MDINIEEYKYKYETHMHTKEGSACAKCSGDEMAKACKESGYSGIFITDHAWGGNTAVDRSLPWEEWVRQYASGYEHAKEWGDKNGLSVFFGLETGFNATEFLIYGVTPEWLISHPEYRTASIEEQFDLVHEAGGIVVQAHPFREEFYIPEIRLFPNHVDGVEGINATHSSHLSQSHNVKEWNDLAIEYATKHGKPMTAGSDTHTTFLFGGGIMSSEKLNSPKDFIDLILSDRMYLLTDGDRIYTRYGELIRDYEL